jgi:hypothetical protein
MYFLQRKTIFTNLALKFHVPILARKFHLMPSPKGKVVRIKTHEGTNLCYDAVAGPSFTGILNFNNQKPGMSFWKYQGRVQTTAYGAEFMASLTNSFKWSYGTLFV